MRLQLDPGKAGFTLKGNRFAKRQKLALPITKLVSKQRLLTAVACLG